MTIPAAVGAGTTVAALTLALTASRRLRAGWSPSTTQLLLRHAFSPIWTFDAVLVTVIGGVGTVHGPVLGAALFPFIREYLALRWVDLHLLILGVLFIAIVRLFRAGSSRPRCACRPSCGDAACVFAADAPRRAGPL